MITRKYTVDVPVTKKKTFSYKIEGIKCSICGKEVDPANKNIFRSKLPVKFFDGWMYTLEKDTLKIDKTRFKNKWYKVIGYTKVQREIVYFIWKLFNRKTVPYVECEKCLKKR